METREVAISTDLDATHVVWSCCVQRIYQLRQTFTKLRSHRLAMLF